MFRKVEDRQILTALAALTEANGYAASLRELADRLGLQSSSTIFQRLIRLRAEGWVEDANGGSGPVKNRTLRLTEAGWTEIGQTPFAPAISPRVQRIPVFRSSPALMQYLEMPAHRERRAAALCLAQQEVTILTITQGGNR